MAPTRKPTTKPGKSTDRPQRKPGRPPVGSARGKQRTIWVTPEEGAGIEWAVAEYGLPEKEVLRRIIKPLNDLRLHAESNGSLNDADAKRLRGCYDAFLLGKPDRSG